MIPLTDFDMRYIRVIKENPDITIKQLMRIFSVSRQASYDRVSRLRVNHIITEKIVNNKGARGYRVDRRKI